MFVLIVILYCIRVLEVPLVYIGEWVSDRDPEYCGHELMGLGQTEAVHLWHYVWRRCWVRRRSDNASERQSGLRTGILFRTRRGWAIAQPWLLTSARSIQQEFLLVDRFRFCGGFYVRVRIWPVCRPDLRRMFRRSLLWCSFCVCRNQLDWDQRRLLLRI